MNKLNINNSEKFLQFKNTLMEVMDNELEKMKLNESIENLDDLDFSALNNVLREVASNMLSKSNNPTVMANYIKLSKESAPIQTACILESKLKRPVTEADGLVYTNEVVGLFESVDKRKFMKDLSKMKKIAKNAVLESNMKYDEFNQLVENSKTQINESISYLLCNKKTPKNVNKYVDALNVVSNYVNENKTSVVVSDKSMDTTSIMSELNSCINECEEWMKQPLNDIVIGLVDENKQQGIFENYKTQCIQSLNECKTDDVETKSKLFTMRDQLTKKEYNKDTFKNDILMMSKFNNVL